MSMKICGEITAHFRKNGNWQDLADILLINGYSLKISPVSKLKELPYGQYERDTDIKITIFEEEGM